MSDLAMQDPLPVTFDQRVLFMSFVRSGNVILLSGTRGYVLSDVVCRPASHHHHFIYPFCGPVDNSPQHSVFTADIAL